MKGINCYLIASLIILSQILLVPANGQQCSALGALCDDSWDSNDVCCGEGIDATCQNPMFSLGFSRCRECRPEGSPCNNRIDCCTDCCAGVGVCQPNSESCNVTEVLTVFFIVYALVAICLISLICWARIYCWRKILGGAAGK